MISPSIKKRCHYNRLCCCWLIARRQGFGENWWSVLACLLPVESDSWCADSTALWTGKGLGCGRLGCCKLFLPPASFLCVFMPFCLELTTGFSHCQAPAVSVRGLLLPWCWFLPMKTVSSAGHCNAFMEHHDYACVLGARWTNNRHQLCIPLYMTISLK